MKIFLSVMVSPETNYIDGKTIYLNEKDKNIPQQSISFNIAGYDKVKSLQPLADSINEWFRKQMPVKELKPMDRPNKQ